MKDISFSPLSNKSNTFKKSWINQNKYKRGPNLSSEKFTQTFKELPITFIRITHIEVIALYTLYMVQAQLFLSFLGCRCTEEPAFFM